MLTIDYKRKTGSTGNGVSSTISFEMVTDDYPTEDDVANAQIDLSYHPAGYGGPMSIERSRMDDGKIKTTWKCYASCD